MSIYICILVLVPSVLSYSSGPLPSACDSMKPGHGGSSQSSAPPYQIVFPQGKTTYSEGENIQVTLEATGGNIFKGFMIQARPSKETYTTYGSIPSPPSGTKNPCVDKGSGKNVVISHGEPSDKTKVTFTWKAPLADVGDIVFVFSVVQAKAIYWVKGVAAQVLKYKAKPTNSPTDASTDASTASSSSKATTTQSQTTGQIDRDPDCDMTIGCFPASAMCSTNCDYLVTWKTSGMNDVEFTLKRKTTSNNYWIGIGFSDDAKMGNTSVTECVSNNGAVNVKNSYNADGEWRNTRSTGNQQYGLTLVSGTYNNGILSCTFKRKKSADLAGVASANEDDTFFSLTTKWYLLVAHGSASGGNKNKHIEYPKFSTSRIDFLKVNTETGTTPAMGETRIDRDPDCDMTIGCFPASAMCSTNCDYLVTWKTSGMNDVEFTLKRKTTSNNYWIGIGFSDDVKMGNTSVTECVSNNGAVDVKNSYNADGEWRNTRSTGNQQYGLTLVSGSYNNGILSCTFKRKKSADLAGVASANEDDTFFSLTTKWYLLVAHGSASGGNKVKHSESPKFSTSRIDFLTVSTDTGTTPAMGETGMIKKDSKCGESLGCYHDCKDSGSCGFLLTWKENGDNIDFTLTCKRPGNNVFCAIGLSKDKKMGDDSVFECVSSDNTVSVYVSYNGGRNNRRLSTPQFGLSSIKASHEDGILKCQFSRMKTFNQVSNMNGRKKRAVDPSASRYFDMNKDFNLLYAFGTAIGGNLNKHQTHPVISSQTADFQSFTDIGAASISKDRIIIHGILMIFAWIFFANCGIFMARFYKTVWPEGMEWCGQKRWFVVHRLAMVTVFLLTAAAAVIIFVHVGGYSEIVGTNFQKAHPILGIIVMCLATVNPIMALFRPHPNTPKRPYFNFAHITVGVTAYVCGIVNIFAGFDQPAIEVPFSAKIVIWIALGWIGLIELTSYIYDCQHKKGSKGEAYEMKDAAADNAPVTQAVPTFKIVILCVHVIGLLAFAIAASAIVAMGDDMHDEM